MSPNQPGSKPHYLILDGLRGVAALLVVIFHLFEARYPVPADNPLHHGYLAVDFFFLLSGFVVGYAYDDRWNRMSIKEFFKIRLIRLQPLVFLGVFIGAVCFWFDPYSQPVSLLKLTGVMLIGFLLVPGPDIRGWGETHVLDGPCWSLLQEYIANIFYALFGRKFNKIGLWIFVVIAAIILTIVAAWRGDVGTGWSYETIWIATVRMLFPFFAGLLLFRSGKKIKLGFTFPLCSLLLALFFALPTFKFNGIYEAAVIIFVFPFIVATGAGGQVTGKWAKLCKFSADISYPIYITHYPFIYIYTAWVYAKHPSKEQLIPVAIGLFIFFILLAYSSLKLFDEPIRKWLKKKFQDTRSKSQVSSNI